MLNPNLASKISYERILKNFQNEAVNRSGVLLSLFSLFIGLHVCVPSHQISPLLSVCHCSSQYISALPNPFLSMSLSHDVCGLHCFLFPLIFPSMTSFSKLPSFLITWPNSFISLFRMLILKWRCLSLVAMKACTQLAVKI